MSRKKKKKARRGNGEGSIEELPSGSYRVEVSLGPDPETGKPRRIRKTLPTYELAVNWRAEQQTLRTRGDLSAPTRVTVAEFSARWQTVKALSFKPGTVKFYRDVLPHVVNRIGTVRLSDLSRRRVEDWMVQMDAEGVPTDRRRKAVAALRTVLKSAVLEGLMARNPAADVARPKKSKKEIRFWTSEQAGQAVAAAESVPLGPLFVVALDSGCRIGELQALHWPELDLDAGTLRVVRTLDAASGEFQPPKTAKSRRTILLEPRTVAVLRRHREAMAACGRDVAAGLVFVGVRGGRVLDYLTVYRQYFARLVERAGVPPIGLHGLRHTSATIQLRMGVWVNVVSERLGHEDVTTTLRLYAHVIEGDQGKSVAALGAALYGQAG